MIVYKVVSGKYSCYAEGSVLQCVYTLNKYTHMPAFKGAYGLMCFDTEENARLFMEGGDGNKILECECDPADILPNLPPRFYPSPTTVQNYLDYMRLADSYMEDWYPGTICVRKLKPIKVL